MLKLKNILIVLFVAVITAGSVNAATLIWSDEFDGTSLNTSNWNIQTGGGGWGNNELQTYTTESVTVSGGQLIITATKPTSTTFESGRINTQGKYSFQYGTIEAVITVPNLANGLWPAFWMMGTSGGAWPACGELDIMEMGSAAAISAGTVNSTVGSAAHWEYNGGYAGYGLTSNSGGGTKTFHLVWTPTMITTYVNGGQIWAFDISGGAASDLEEFVSWPYYILINMAVGGNYTGITLARKITATFPAQLKVDYVRVYQDTTTTSTTTTASSTTTTTTAGGCLENGAACTANSECCSGRCAGSKCR